MDATGSVTRLFDQLRSSDKGVRDAAAAQIWGRYFPQLLEKARRHLHTRVRQREDEADVLQDMYKSFCGRMEKGAFELNDRSDLWRLLVTMTLNKARKAGARHQRQKRDVSRDQQVPTNEEENSFAPNWAFEVM